MISMRLSGLAEIDAALKEIGSTAQIKGATAGTLAAARAVQKAAQRTVPVKTGTLKKSIIVKRWRKFESRGHFQHIVGPAAGKRAKYDGWYGRLVEFGTAPHDIIVKKGASHRGLGKDGKFGRHVRHPGAKARPWLGTAFESVFYNAIQAFADAYAKAALRLGIIQPSKYVGHKFEVTSGV